jgi:Domain of unknown function (DUF4190)
MTTPPADGPSSSDADPGRWATPDSSPASSEPVSLGKPEEPFDPYRYGAPEHHVPAEYAPPGYIPPPVTARPLPSYPPRQQGPGYPPGPGYPGPGYPYQAQGAYAQQYPQPRTGNGKAIAALVLGILAIVFCWTSIFDVVLVALAVIFGFLGLSDAKRSGGGRGMAISGLVCALVGAILATVLTVVIYSRLGHCVNDFNRGSSAYNNCVQNGF